jgi:hypothetical protein
MRLFTVHLIVVAVLWILVAPMSSRAGAASVKHVVVISIDGLHQTDLDAYRTAHPSSMLAKFSKEGVMYTNARTPFPSDSFPGLTAIVTGAHPRSSGVYFDDTWNRSLLPAGTTDCPHAAPGAEVKYVETLDLDPDSIDAGYGVGNLATRSSILSNIYKLPLQARALINKARLPVDPKSCQGVFPHEYLRVNTIFEVAKAHGLHTAWSDKHAAYDLVNGPSGAGVDDLFTPEINGLVPDGGGDDWNKDNLDTQFYDALKVTAVINWAHGGNHDGGPNAGGEPAIFGMNFQSVSTAQKSNLSHFKNDSGKKGLGGYIAGGTIPGPALHGALVFIDAQLARIVAALDPRDTLVILSAKHGQSPLVRSQLRLIDDGEIVAALNSAWAAGHPTWKSPFVSFSVSDDGTLMWFSDRSKVATEFAKAFLWDYRPLHVGGSDTRGTWVNHSGTVFHSGLRQILAGKEAADFIGVPLNDDRVPDLIGIATVGTVYSSPVTIKKIAEHGGDALQDRHVPILAWGAGVRNARIDNPVETTQIAPTVLKALGISPRELKGVEIEHTAPLPGLR